MTGYGLVISYLCCSLLLLVLVTTCDCLLPVFVTTFICSDYLCAIPEELLHPPPLAQRVFNDMYDFTKGSVKKIGVFFETLSGAVCIAYERAKDKLKEIWKYLEDHTWITLFGGLLLDGIAAYLSRDFLNGLWNGSTNSRPSTSDQAYSPDDQAIYADGQAGEYPGNGVYGRKVRSNTRQRQILRDLKIVGGNYTQSVDFHLPLS